MSIDFEARVSIWSLRQTGKICSFYYKRRRWLRFLSVKMSFLIVIKASNTAEDFAGILERFKDDILVVAGNLGMQVKPR